MVGRMQGKLLQGWIDKVWSISRPVPAWGTGDSQQHVCLPALVTPAPHTTFISQAEKLRHHVTTRSNYSPSAPEKRDQHSPGSGEGGMWLRVHDPSSGDTLMSQQRARLRQGYPHDAFGFWVPPAAPPYPQGPRVPAQIGASGNPTALPWKPVTLFLFLLV